MTTAADGFSRQTNSGRVMSQRPKYAVPTMLRFLGDVSGASAVMVAIALPVLIGFATLGAETGLWYTIKRQNQSAADAAAISAVYEVIAGKTDPATELTPAASEAASQNGYSGSPPLVVHPYTDSVVKNGIAVTLQQSQPGLLASLFLPSVTIVTTAVAAIKVLDNPCILSLATNGTGADIRASSSVAAPNCSVAANSKSFSSIAVESSGSSVTAATLVTRGEISLAGTSIDPAALPPEFTLASRPLIGAPSVADPYTTHLTHDFLTTNMPSQCASGPPYPANSQICGDLAIAGALYLPPGTYWITDGSLLLQPNAVLTCSSCTIIFTTLNSSGGIVGNVQIPNGVTVTVQAPNSGVFSGLLMIQDRFAVPAAASVFEGAGNMKLTGLLYFPESTVEFNGNPNPTCTVLVAKWLTIDGNSAFNTSGCRAAGLGRLPRVHTAALAE